MRTIVKAQSISASLIEAGGDLSVFDSVPVRSQQTLFGHLPGCVKQMFRGFWVVSILLLLCSTAIGQDEAALHRSIDQSDLSQVAEQWNLIKPFTPRPEVSPVAVFQLGGGATDQLKVVFQQYAGAGRSFLHADYYGRDGEDWNLLFRGDLPEMIHLVRLSGEWNLKLNEFEAVWDLTPSQGGDRTALITKNPFELGIPVPFYAVAIQASSGSPDAVVVTYRSELGKTLHGQWQLVPGGIQVEFNKTIDQDGNYSFLYAPFARREVPSIHAVLMPPRSQYLRVPEAPRLLPSALMPYPMAVAEYPLESDAGGNVTLGLAADVALLPQSFPTNTDFPSPYGFGLLDWQKRTQPLALSPLPGGARTAFQANDRINARFNLIVHPGTWDEAARAASKNIFGVEDYRQPAYGSLSDAVINMFNLIRDDVASGWDPELKGFYNIEFKSGITQASPLTLLSAANLSRDAAFYAERALPTIAYLTSRAWGHFGRPYEIGNWAGAVPGKPPYSTASLTTTHAFYGSPVWQGVNKALGDRLNPWLNQRIFPNGGIAHPTNPTQRAPKWASLLSIYQEFPSDTLIEEVVALADQYIDTEVFSDSKKQRSHHSFYDIGTYPYWIDFLSLYEITGNSRYLEAARIGATHTAVGLWAHPQVTADKIRVHPEGKFTGDTRILWKNDEWYRLGANPDLWEEDRSGRQWLSHIELAEESVEEWKVSRVGLGFETPGTLIFPTFIRGNQGFKNIMMSALSPHLLRLAHLSGDDFFQTQARNMTIGRFTTYPGYYYTEYTNHTIKPHHSTTGPDAGRIYYHHIPVHLAFTLDYLFTDAEKKSGGNIRFPWVMQQGYAWFANRSFGFEAGSVFDIDGLTPRIDANLVANLPPQIDWLLAEKKDMMVLILMNQSLDPVSVSPRLNMSRLNILPEAAVSRREHSSDEWTQIEGSTSAFNLTLSPGSLVALKMARDASVSGNDSLAALQNGYVKLPVGKALGDNLHIYRIRSAQFGDALHAFIEGGDRDDLDFRIRVADTNLSEERSRYPYEALFYPIDTASAYTLEISIRSRETNETKTFQAEIEP